MPVAVEDSCRRVIAFVDVYTGASFFYTALVYCDVLDIRFIMRLDLFRLLPEVPHRGCTKNYTASGGPTLA